MLELSENQKALIRHGDSEVLKEILNMILDELKKGPIKYDLRQEMELITLVLKVKGKY